MIRSRLLSLGLTLCFLAVPASAKAPVGRYSVNTTDGTVYDTLTKLTWQRDGSASGALNWANAKTYCAGLASAGGGWRLPEVTELRSIVDLHEQKPAIDPAAFPGTPADWFWSNTAYKGGSGSAWIVVFGSGYSSYGNVNYDFSVRCVR